VSCAALFDAETLRYGPGNVGKPLPAAGCPSNQNKQGEITMSPRSPKSRAPRRLARALAALALATGLANAEAASISLDPGGASAPLGAQVSFDLVADFDGTVVLGGAVDLAWDAQVLEFFAFDFSAGMAPPRRDASFDVVDLQSPGLVSIGFANFGGLTLPAGTTIGSVIFSVLGGPVPSTALMLSDSVKWAGFFDVAGDPVAVDYLGAEFGRLNAVPLPAGQWLLLSAVGALGAALRRRSAVV
jgi:hypothetical protein